MSLREFYRGPLTHHELINLIVQLPRGCALDRAQRGEAAEWQIGDHLAVLQINDARQAAAGKRLQADQLIYPPGQSPADRAKARLRERQAKAGGG